MNHNSTGISFREQAMLRAAARQNEATTTAYDSSDDENDISKRRSFSSLPYQHSFAQSSSAASDSVNPIPSSHFYYQEDGAATSSSSAQQNHQQQSASSPDQMMGMTTTAIPTTGVIDQVRREWNMHGGARSQALEDKRWDRIGDGGVDHPAAAAVRVIDAQTRIDLNGNPYTTYRIRIWHSKPPPSPALIHSPNNSLEEEGKNGYTIERRYSDFCKLHAALQDSLPFPPKHWAGRMGNWEMAKIWAPASYDMLIQTRIQQLDTWLVEIVYRYNHSQLNREQSHSVHEFMSVSRKPPCQQRNEILPQERWKWSNPIAFTLSSSIRQAVSTIQIMTQQDPSNSIPLDLLQSAKGLMFLTVAKAGFVLSGRIGTGVLVARLPDNNDNTTTTSTAAQWSAPVALGTVGIGWGAQLGGDCTHYLVVLTNETAVANFADRKLSLGAEFDVSVGPVGRSASQQLQSSKDWTLVSAYAYAHSQGFFVGVSLEGSVISVRHDINTKFYGRQVQVSDLLKHPGRNTIVAAKPLYDALDRALQIPIPKYAFRPSSLWTSASATPIDDPVSASSTLFQAVANSEIQQQATNPRPVGYVSRSIQHEEF
jgi:lipid-binding SYLF domain-containing protein